MSARTSKSIPDVNCPINSATREILEVAIVGAGPYGLSLAAHLRACGVPFRIFGRPMETWSERMPKGMLLKSDAFASNLYDPHGHFTLERFCSANGIEYHDTNIPVSLGTFVAYGRAFQERLVPEVEQKMVLGIDQVPGGFVIRLDSGEIVAVRRIVLAVGISHFGYIPPNLAHLPPEFLSHSTRHQTLNVLEAGA